MTVPVTVRGIQIGGGQPVICIPVTGKTETEILSSLPDVLSEQPDLVEWRIDHFEGVRDHALLLQTLQNVRVILNDVPLLVTLRTAKEGGALEVSAEEYAAVLKTVIDSGSADLIDAEIFVGDETFAAIAAEAHAHGIPVIASSHDFHQTPPEEELLRIFAKMDEAGADLLKIAVMPQNRRDVLTLLSATEKMSAMTRKPLITMSMSSLGMISRLCGEVFGSALTFGTANEASAPGQPDARRLRQVLELIHENSKSQ